MEFELSLKELLIRFFMILLSFFIMNRIFFFSQGAIESTSSYLLYPIIKTEKFFIDPVFQYFKRQSNIVTLQKENENLQESNQRLQAEIIRLESLLDFKNLSADLSDYAVKYDFSSQKLVQILMRSFDDAGHFFWVDSGSNHGIAINMIAVCHNNIVGRVIHVDPLISKIALITDQHSKIAVTSLHTKSAGIVCGHNNFIPTLEFIPHYETVEHNDMVISSGQGLVYPQGFAVGQIADFFIYDTAYHININLLVDLQTIQHLYLVCM